MSQLAMVMLALVGRMERTYAIEPAARVRIVAAGKGKRSGRPCVVDPAKLAYAGPLRDLALSISEIVRAPDITRSSLYRHLDATGGRLGSSSSGSLARQSETKGLGGLDETSRHPGAVR